MKKIYIILTYTGTVLAKTIKYYTSDEFAHVSISLDMELNEMYSFGRLNPYNPFIGGFMHEYINKGTFKRFKKTTTKIYSLEVSNEQYNNVKENIEKVKKEKQQYKFNTLGLFAVVIHKRIESKNSFYCAEFVKYILEKSNIDTKLPLLVRPEDFKQIDGLKEIYSGVLKDYNLKEM